MKLNEIPFKAQKEAKVQKANKSSRSYSLTKKEKHWSAKREKTCFSSLWFASLRFLLVLSSFSRPNCFVWPQEQCSPISKWILVVFSSSKRRVCTVQREREEEREEKSFPIPSWLTYFDADSFIFCLDFQLSLFFSFSLSFLVALRAYVLTAGEVRFMSLILGRDIESGRKERERGARSCVHKKAQNACAFSCVCVCVTLPEVPWISITVKCGVDGGP